MHRGRRKGKRGKRRERWEGRRKKGLKKDCIIFKCVIHKIRIDHNFVEYLFLC